MYIYRPSIDVCDDCKVSFDWEEEYNRVGDDIFKDNTYYYLRCKTAKFFDVGISYEIPVFWYECECSKYHMDGKELHLVNQNDKYIITHQLMNQFALFLAEHSNSNFSSFLQNSNNAYKLRDPNSPTLDVGTFIDLWESFIDIQLWEKTLGCFDCFDRSKHNSFEDIEYEHMVSDGVCAALKSRRAPSLYIFIYILSFVFCDIYYISKK